MTDVARQKFTALMTEIESLEETVADLQVRCQAIATDPAMACEAQLLQERLLGTQRQLGEKRTELQRISDGCGKPRVG